MSVLLGATDVLLFFEVCLWWNDRYNLKPHDNDQFLRSARSIVQSKCTSNIIFSDS